MNAFFSPSMSYVTEASVQTILVCPMVILALTATKRTRQHLHNTWLKEKFLSNIESSETLSQIL